MDYSRQSKINHPSPNDLYGHDKVSFGYYANQYSTATSSHQLHPNGVQNGFRDPHLLSNPLFTNWEEANVGQVPPLLDAYGVPVSSSCAFNVASRNGFEHAYNLSMSHFPAHSESNNCYCQDCARNANNSSTFNPQPKVEAQDVEYHSADHHLQKGYEKHLNTLKMSHEPNELRGSKSAPEQINLNPGFESTAPRRTIRKKQRNKCIKPVKPISLYGLFFRETYKKVKECQPNSKFGDISREVSHRWEMLCSHEKAKYKKRIDEAKKEYKKDLEEYNKNYFEIFSNNTEQKGMVPLNCYHQEVERPESQPTSKISISGREEDMMTEINFPLNGNANM